MALTIADTCQMDETELKSLYTNLTIDKENFTFDGRQEIKIFGLAELPSGLRHL